MKSPTIYRRNLEKRSLGVCTSPVWSGDGEKISALVLVRNSGEDDDDDDDDDEDDTKT